MSSTNSTIPRSLSEVPDVTVKPAPDGHGLAAHAMREGQRVLFILPDPANAPTDALRDTLEARNVASVIQHCPLCGGGNGALREPVAHTHDCPAADENLNAVLSAALKVSPEGMRRKRARDERSFRRAGSAAGVATMTTAHAGRL